MPQTTLPCDFLYRNVANGNFSRQNVCVTVCVTYGKKSNSHVKTWVDCRYVGLTSLMQHAPKQGTIQYLDYIQLRRVK